MDIATVVCLTIIVVAGLVCNILALVFISQKARTKLAIKDKVVAILCGVNAIQTCPYCIELYSQINGLTDQICLADATLICSLTYTSIGYFVFLAVERYLSILHPLQYYQWFHQFCIEIWLCLPPIIGFTLGLFPLFGWGGYGKSREESLYCSLDFKDSSSASLSYFITVIVLMLFIPLLVTSVCFISIICELQHKVDSTRRKYGKSSTMSRESLRSVNQQFKSYMMTGFVYFASWIPYTIVCARFYMGLPVSVVFEHAAVFLSKSSIITSIFIYCLVEKQFLDFIKKQPMSTNV